MLYVVKISLAQILHLLLTAAFLLALCACSRKPDPNTLVMIIESSPNSLDPRIGIDAQSERIDELSSTRSSNAMSTSTCNLHSPPVGTFPIH